MRKSLVLQVLVLMLGEVFAQVNTGYPYESLFNGTNLSGWSVKCKSADASKTFFSVDSGSILINSTNNHDYMWLINDKEYGDFIIKLRYQAYQSSPGNSGVQIRSRYDSGDNGGWMNGFQIDIMPNETFRIGYIYDETRKYQHWIYPNAPGTTFPETYKSQVPPIEFYFSDQKTGWNELEIRAIGTKITTVANGVVRTDWNAKGILDDSIHVNRKVSDKGFFALQLHMSDVLRMRYKDIYIYDISSDRTPPAALRNFEAKATGPKTISLFWEKIHDAGTDSITVRARKDEAPPSSPDDGMLVKKISVNDTTLTIAGLDSGALYFYSAFVHDLAGNWSPAAQDSARPEDLSPVRVVGTRYWIAPRIATAAVIHDLRGQRIPISCNGRMAELPPGVFILRQGSTTEKFVLTR